jgi:hypothetical protein
MVLISGLRLLALGGCSRMNQTVTELAAPPGAAVYSGTGAATTAAQLALADLHSRLREWYSPPWHMERFSVPTGTGWDAITVFTPEKQG